MPGRTPYEAVESFLVPLRAALGCVARAKITTSRGGISPKIGDQHQWSINDGGGVGLRRAEALGRSGESLEFFRVASAALREADGPLKASSVYALAPYVGSLPFVGRAEDLNRLDSWAVSDDSAMVIEAIGGSGKSALSWRWATQRASIVVPDLAGRFWWSFYDRPSFTNFLEEAVAYTTDQLGATHTPSGPDLLPRLIASLRERSYLLVLDGVERLLVAYQRMDSGTHDGEPGVPDPRRAVDPWVEQALRAMTVASPSKVVFTTRLTPSALEAYPQRLLPGVRRLQLSGLTDADTATLLDLLDVHGSAAAVRASVGSFDNHVLLVGLLAGLVRAYRPAPGDLDRWLVDPAAGGDLRLTELNLVQRRSHVLRIALEALPPTSRQLLVWMAAMSGPVNWSTLEFVNPYRSAGDDRFVDDGVRARLDAALRDLEDRGLLGWDRVTNTYDMHPIIRAFAVENLDRYEEARIRERLEERFTVLADDDEDLASRPDDVLNRVVLFRALVRLGLVERAVEVWTHGLGEALWETESYAVIVEMLEPLARHAPLGLRIDLVAARQMLGQKAAQAPPQRNSCSPKRRRLVSGWLIRNYEGGSCSTSVVL